MTTPNPSTEASANLAPITETFSDGSTITTDTNGNRTVFGTLAHKAYFERLKAERISPDMDNVIVKFCMNSDGTRKAELIRRNTNPLLVETFGRYSYEVWSEIEPSNVIRYPSLELASKAFIAACVHGTNGMANIVG